MLVPLLLLALLGPLVAAPVADAQANRTPAAAGERLDLPRPGDVVRLQIWREPDMSGEFRIDEQGQVVLPRLGQMRVTHLAPEELEQKLVAAYERFLRHKSIDVTLLRRVQIMGAVRTPGLYPVDATMNVSDALALAGGATSDGVPDRVQLIRDGKRLSTRLSGNTPIASSTIRSGDQLYVPERSWFVRNSGVVAAGLSASVSLVIAFLAR